MINLTDLATLQAELGRQIALTTRARADAERKHLDLLAYAERSRLKEEQLRVEMAEWATESRKLQAENNRLRGALHALRASINGDPRWRGADMSEFLNVIKSALGV